MIGRLTFLDLRLLRPSLSESSLVDKALGKSCLLAYTSSVESRNASSVNCNKRGDNFLIA